MHLQNVGYAPSVTNVSTTGSYLVTNICSEQLTNTSLTTIAGDLIEILARERHARMLERYRENRPGISYQNRSSAGCIMCTNGQLDNTDGVFAPYTRRIVIRHRLADGQPRVWVELTEWDLSPGPGDDKFTLALPPQAERVDFFSGSLK